MPIAPPGGLHADLYSNPLVLHVFCVIRHCRLSNMKNRIFHMKWWHYARIKNNDCFTMKLLKDMKGRTLRLGDPSGTSIGLLVSRFCFYGE